MTKAEQRAAETRRRVKIGPIAWMWSDDPRLPDRYLTAEELNIRLHAKIEGRGRNEMTFDEAVAVYLYLMHAPIGTRDERVFNEAWGVIC